MRSRARPLLAAAALLLAAPVLAKPPLRPGERIDLNRASVSELTRLPGIGPKRAKAIVELRRRRPFRRVEDVLAVKGLGRAWLRKVEGHVYVSEPGNRGQGQGQGQGRIAVRGSRARGASADRGPRHAHRETRYAGREPRSRRALEDRDTRDTLGAPSRSPLDIGRASR